jgi:hypothetical protein
MKSFLDYLNNVDRLIQEAEELDIPHFQLLQHKKEVKKYFDTNKQPSVIVEEKENVRYWKKKGKIIHYETIG